MHITRREFVRGMGGLAGTIALTGTLGCSQGPGPGSSASKADPTLEAKNLKLVSWTELNGHGNMGEGIAIQQLGNRRIAYLANESGPIGMSVVDVTNPKEPAVLKQIPAENPKVRFNSLSMSGNILVVARQVQDRGDQPAGVAVYDASDPENLKQLAFFNAGGPYSQGCHYVWFVDGRYMHMSTGMPDFKPSHPSDNQIYVIADMKDPEHPKEVSRFWLPGQKDGEKPFGRTPQYDNGHKLHNVEVLPSKPDRAYCGWIDSGVAILDISDIEHPKLVSQWNPSPPMRGFYHTAMPHPERGLLVVSQEAIDDNGCGDSPKLIWVLNMEGETNLVPMAIAPQPDPNAYCQRGGRFGAHNQHENHEQPTAKTLHNAVVGSYFAGGVRIYDIKDPMRPEEIAYYVPKKPASSRVNSAQINDVYVDEKGYVYAVERFGGGLYILEYTGKAPLS